MKIKLNGEKTVLYLAEGITQKRKAGDELCILLLPTLATVCV